MSRLYFDDDWDYNVEGLQQGWLRSAIRGKRGQQFLRELVTALDALPTPELCCGALEDAQTGCCCAFGAVRRLRGPENVNLWFHPEEEDMSPYNLAEPFGVSNTLAWAVVQANEEMAESNTEQARRRRWADVRAWAAGHLLPVGEEDEP
jgi:hypothetical protein